MNFFRHPKDVYGCLYRYVLSFLVRGIHGSTGIASVLGAFLCILCLTFSLKVNAAGFSLYTESSVDALGHYAAGSAAEAYNAATAWYNPAGLVYLKHKQAITSNIAVIPYVSLSGSSDFYTLYSGTTPLNYIQDFSNLRGDNQALIPALYYALPLGKNIAAGFSVLAPFGLSTDYNAESAVRYGGTLSDLKTVNLSSALAARVYDNFSFGIGIDMQFAEVSYDAVLGSPASLQYLQTMGGLAPVTYLDSSVENTGTSTGIGVHMGIILEIDEHNRFGLNWQSRVKHQFDGNSTLTGRLADPSLTDINAQFYSPYLKSGSMYMPDVITFSTYHELSSNLQLLTSVVYTCWSVIQSIDLYGVAGFSEEAQAVQYLDISTPQGLNDTWRFALGFNYIIDDEMMLRIGAGYDGTPTVNAYRDVRMPDASRYALSLGMHYVWSEKLAFDFGYTHVFAVDNAHLDYMQKLDDQSSFGVTGTAQSYADLLGIQASWSFD
jgi:long-chain fatty acid transport protein